MSSFLSHLIIIQNYEQNIFLIVLKKAGWIEKIFQQYIITPNKYLLIYQMFRQIQGKITGLLEGKFNELMQSQKFIKTVVQVFKYSFALLVIILLGNIISMLVELTMALLLATIRYILSILTLIAETMKENLILLGVLIIVMALMQKIPINKLVYNAFARLIIADDAICSICIVNNSGPCDYVEPNCGNGFHKSHMDWWLQNSNICPYCINVVPMIGRQCQKIVYLEFLGHMIRLRKIESGIIVGGTVLLTLYFM